MNDVLEHTAPAPVAVPEAAPPQPEAPVRRINAKALQGVADELVKRFAQYKSDRRVAEMQWIKNLYQYLGEYEPDFKQKLDPRRSQAYPKMTRVKVISVLARLMNLMFPGNDRNWELKASPNADMSPDDVKLAVQKLMEQNAQAGVQMQITPELVQQAVQNLADERAKQTAKIIDDQLQEIGGDQTLDHVALNRKVIQSACVYGAGVWVGPFAREETRVTWGPAPGGQFAPQTVKTYKPQFEFLPLWDFYPDMSAKTFYSMDGYFRRYVMHRGQLRQLKTREDYFASQIDKVFKEHPNGNYTPQTFESELRAIGVAENVNPQAPGNNKYEVIVWHGLITGQQLKDCGEQIEEKHLNDDIEAVVWMVGNIIIKAEMNAWRRLGVEVRQVHVFNLDEDDTSIFSRGIPEVVRDSQMSINAAVRMLLDNASVVCGPNVEVNMDLVRLDQDLTNIHAYKVWYRNGDGVDAQYPAVRAISLDGHLMELQAIVEMFMRFMDLETFVGPATGGDMDRAPKEPMRTAAGASMLRGDAALPFKDIVRNFDTFTQSVIYALVQFNRQFNKSKVLEGDYNVVARGATSLIAKEVRGMQLDQLAQTLRPEEMDHVDERKFIERRMASRDLDDILVTPDEAQRRKQARSQAMADQADAERAVNEATVKKLLADAFKAITQGQKNASAADAQTVNAAIAILEQGMQDAFGTGPEGGDQPARKSDTGGK